MVVVLLKSGGRRWLMGRGGVDQVRSGQVKGDDGMRGMLCNSRWSDRQIAR